MHKKKRNKKRARSKQNLKKPYQRMISKSQVIRRRVKKLRNSKKWYRLKNQRNRKNKRNNNFKKKNGILLVKNQIKMLLWKNQRRSTVRMIDAIVIKLQ